MGKYKITPLHLGDITRPKSNMINGYEGKEVQDFPLVAYYLEGEHKIMVDTGGCAPEEPRGIAAQPYTRTPGQEPEAALKSIGVDPGEIEYVIFTHIHWDHAYNNGLFKNAKFICQRKEYESVASGADVIGYVPEEVLKYEYELTDGDAVLFDGVSVMLTPGHTRGMQCVAVDTEDGKIVITGDLITVRESFNKNPPECNGLYPNEEALAQMRAGVAKVAAMTRKILPGHEPDVFKPNMGF
ncbi:MAG: N-acyl homoserine lactonase family protein [Oscillospiraceae bacterium]|nr:N-acyl homoserine lactonase family protein [Oscillospiraceae bacterium]